MPYTTLCRSSVASLSAAKAGRSGRGFGPGSPERKEATWRAASDGVSPLALAPVRPFFSTASSYQGANSAIRSEEHTSELQSLMRISYAVFCLKKKHTQLHPITHQSTHY